MKLLVLAMLCTATMNCSGCEIHLVDMDQPELPARTDGPTDCIPCDREAGTPCIPSLCAERTPGVLCCVGPVNP